MRRRRTWHTAKKSLDHYENPRNVGSFDKDDDAVGTGMVGAPACGDVMKLQIKVGKDGIIEDAQVQDLRLRLGDRLVLAGDRMGQGQDAGPGAGDQEHADRRGAGAAAGEDPLLDPGRGRDQGRGRRLQEEARRQARAPPQAANGGGDEWRRMAITLTEKAAKHVAELPRQARQGRRPAPGRAHHRLLGHGLQARVRRRGRARGRSSSRATASRWSSTRRACRISTAPSSTSRAKA